MANFDRSKFKATSLSILKEQEKRVEEVLDLKGDRSRAKYLNLTKGINKIRIYPAHPNTSSYIYPKVVSWVTLVVDKRNEKGEVIKDKYGNPIKEEKRKPIFNSRIHGGTPKDIIEEYLKFCEERFTNEFPGDKNMVTSKMAPLVDWKRGIRPITSWVFYGKRYGEKEEFGLFEVTEGVKRQMNKLSITESSDEPISVDPFSDPDEGKALLLEFDPEAQKQGRYTANIEWRGNYALSEEELENFLEFEPLEKLLVNSYKVSDFKRSLEGLQRVDSELNINNFAEEKWLDICEEIASYYPEEEEGEEEGGEDRAELEDGEEKIEKEETLEELVEEKLEETEEEKDTLDLMNREELKKFIKENSLDIKIYTSYSDEHIRGMIRENLQLQSVSKEEKKSKPETTTVSPTPIVSPKEKVNPTPSKDLPSISELRNRLNKNK